MSQHLNYDRRHSCDYVVDEVSVKFRSVSVQCFYTILQASDLLKATKFSGKLSVHDNSWKSSTIIFVIMCNPYTASNNKVILFLCGAYLLDCDGTCKFHTASWPLVRSLYASVAIDSNF